MKSIGVILIAGVIVVMAITGIMCFLLPFSRVTTNTHLVFALLMVIATIWHLIERRKAFGRHVVRPAPSGGGNKTQAVLVAIVVLTAIGLACLMNLQPVRSLSALSYEGRNKHVIFRSHPDVVYDEVGSQLKVLKDSGGLVVNMEVDLRTEQFEENNNSEVFMVIWAEDDNGNLIETLFLSESLCFENQHTFNGYMLNRRQILPVWSHRKFEKMTDEEDHEVDAVSSATITRSFSLNTVLRDELRGFHIKMEVNRLGDINETFSPDSALEFMRPLPGIGQPSVVYTTFLDLHEEHFERYFLLKYEGHGAPAGYDGFVTYGHEGLTTARKIVDKALLHIEFNEPGESTHDSNRGVQ